MMVILTGLSYIFIGFCGLYTVWNTFVSVSSALEVFKMKYMFSAFFVDILLSVMGAFLLILSMFGICVGVNILAGGVLL